MELAKNWRRVENTWFLHVDRSGVAFINIACISPTSEGWVLEIWIGPRFSGGWVRHAEFSDLETAKAVGRIVAAQYLDQNF